MSAEKLAEIQAKLSQRTFEHTADIVGNDSRSGLLISTNALCSTLETAITSM